MIRSAVTAPAFTVTDIPGGDRNLIGIARVSARTLLNIANDILDLSRIEAGQVAFETAPMRC